jgi:hypothetical protein
MILSSDDNIVKEELVSEKQVFYGLSIKNKKVLDIFKIIVYKSVYKTSSINQHQKRVYRLC